MFRYMGLIWDPADPEQIVDLQILRRRLDASPSRWHPAGGGSGLNVFCADTLPGVLEPHVLSHGSGIIVGALFERSAALRTTTTPSARVDDQAAATIVGSRGRALITEYWGNYVAFIDGPENGIIRIVKDPTGNLPCYLTSFRRITIVFSCLGDCVALRILSFSINWTYVTHRVACGGFDAEQNALNEVSQVYHGECVEVASTRRPAVKRRYFYWTPMSFPESDKPIEKPIQASSALRSTVLACTHAWAAGHRAILQRLSGGLDSSIIFGCLKTAPTCPEITCYTYHSPGSDSDERRWARLAVGRTECEHIELPFDPTRIQLERMMGLKPLAEPVSCIAYLDRGAVERELSATRSCTAVFSGEGGDSGFGSECIGLAADDYLLRHGIDRELFRIAARIAAFRDLTIWAVLRRALRRRLNGWQMSDYGEVLEMTCRLAAPEIQQIVRNKTKYPHPWFSDASQVPWGIIHRLGSLVVAPEFYDPFCDPSELYPVHIPPLYSQPLVELCLRIPIYTHFENGRERGLARRAFANKVAPEILRRQWKDRAPRFFEDLAHHNLDFIRQLLLDGLLVREGLLNRSAIEEALSGTMNKRDFVLGEIFNYIDLEIWFTSLPRPSLNLAAA